MRFSARLLAVAAAALTAAPAPTTAAPTTALASRAAHKCVDGVLVLAARGSDSSWHNANKTNPNYADIGGLRAIGNAVVSAVGKGSYVAAVPYAASLDNYFTSLGHGIDSVQSTIATYTTQCKGKVTPRIVLLGYSQGAQVMSAALAGGEGRKALGSAYVKTVVAGAIFADPSFLYGVEPLNAGSDKNASGIFAMPAKNATYLNKTYGKVLRSYCQYFDFFCSSGDGDSSLAIHAAEVQTYTNASEKFLLPIVKKFA